MMLVISFAVFIAALLSLLIYARWNYGTLEKCGIPVISPSFLLGSVPEIHEKVQHLEDIRRAEKYGQIYGVRTPTFELPIEVLITLLIFSCTKAALLSCS